MIGIRNNDNFTNITGNSTILTSNYSITGPYLEKGLTLTVLFAGSNNETTTITYNNAIVQLSNKIKAENGRKLTFIYDGDKFQVFGMLRSYLRAVKYDSETEAEITTEGFTAGEKVTIFPVAMWNAAKPTKTTVSSDGFMQYDTQSHIVAVMIGDGLTSAPFTGVAVRDSNFKIQAAWTGKNNYLYYNLFIER